MYEHSLNVATAREQTKDSERTTPIPDMLRRQLGDATLENLMRAEHNGFNPLTEIETGLKEAIVGQEEAIESVMSVLSREKFRNPKRPLANLLFLGPTGVGKSETAKELARLLHEDSGGFLKIDCSSYSRGYEVAALVGSPPGYVGREQPPIFDSAIIEREKSVVLFDEIEKGSQPLWDMLLQIMDDGEISLIGNGKTVSFKNSIVIMTSNLGSHEMMNLLDAKKIGFQSDQSDSVTATREQINKAANSALKEYFRPEFINRFDKKIVFTPLNDMQLQEVLGRYMREANERYREADIQLTVSEELQKILVTSNTERFQYGARPILREYDYAIESKLASLVHSGSIPQGSSVYAVATDELIDATGPASSRVAFYYGPSRKLQEDIAYQHQERPTEEPCKLLSTSTEIARLFSSPIQRPDHL